MGEHILITGEPHIGKSTLLKKVVGGVSLPTHGFWAEEVADQGVRTGFEMVTHRGERLTLASTKTTTEFPVSKYFVQLHNLERLVQSLLPIPREGLLYLDEIGQVQLYSAEFVRLARIFLDSPLPLIGTISQVYAHPFIEEVKARRDVRLLTVTAENRDQLSEKLIKDFKF